VLDFMKEYLFPHFQEVIIADEDKEVVEKVLECIRDIAEEFGPSGIEAHINLIMASVDQLLDKAARC